jgi:probable rRNA maturation factor
MTATPRPRQAALGIAVEVLAESPLWGDEPQAETVVRRAVLAAAAATAAAGEISLVLADDAALRALNRTWRGIDKPTNVLSFPAAPAVRGEARGPRRPRILGDIAIAHETVRREAAAEGKPFEHHLAHLAVHGFLHLLGYDHESESEAEDMERLECTILAGLGVSDPYAPRDSET